MKNLIKTFAILFTIMAFASCMSSKKASDAIVTPLSDNTATANGSIVYALPRTVFNVTVKMERTVNVPGPYWKYAGDLLGLTKVIQSYDELWSIKGISVESAEEIDPSQYYVITGSSVSGGSMLSLRKEGLILDINPRIYYGSGNITSSESNEAGQFRQADLGSDEYFSIQRDTAYKRVNVDSTFIRLPYVVEKKKRLPDEQLAERAAKRLMEMRDGKHLILTGEATVFPQSDAAINEMNRMEREYTELFTGKSMKQERTYTFQVIPSDAMAGKPVNLFSFSEATGVSENKQGGEPVYIELTPEKKTSALASLKSNAEAREDMGGYLYYRLPDVVNMKIRYGDEILFSSRRLVYQYGEILRLPGNFIQGK